MLTRTAVLAACACAPAAHAQWTFTNLHPGTAVTSQAMHTSHGQQVGFNSNDPALWTGSAGSHVNLLPAGAHSGAIATDDGTQVGLVRWSGFSDRQAGLWTGTADSWSSLHPSGAFLSTAYGVSGTQQVGEATFTSDQNLTRAGVWSGTSASWVNLHPSVLGVNTSSARGTDGVQQVGQVGVGVSSPRAAMWSGTAGSFINLHPAGQPSGSTSIANGVHSGQQVGTVGGTAALWSGSAASYLNLNPAGASSSRASAVFSGIQVGAARFTGGPTPSVDHAGLWRGSAASWEDLSSYVPAGYSDSAASSVWSDGSTLYVAGSVYNTTTNFFEAALWTQSIPAAPTTAVLILAATGLATTRRRR